MLRCVEVYKEMYKKDPLDVSFTPYRICPIGAHSDHQLGKITGLAIDKGIHILQKPQVLWNLPACSLTSVHSSM